MPFKSKAQEKWAFATHQPWAKEWASKTSDSSKLPKHVKKSKKSESLRRTLIGK